MEHLPMNMENIPQPSERAPLSKEEIEGAKLFTALGSKGLLDQWGNLLGEPNPDMKEYLPRPRTRKEKKIEIERRSDPPPPPPAVDEQKAYKQIQEFIAGWRERHKTIGEEEGSRIWEEMTEHLMGRGRLRLRDVILKALYGLDT